MASSHHRIAHTRSLLLLIIVALGLSATAGAQPGRGRLGEGRPPMSPEMKAAIAELRSDIRGYVEKSILPQLLEWKMKLDNAMDPADLASLNALRARALELRRENRELGQGMRRAWKDEDYTALKDRRDDMKDMKGEWKALLETLKPLARKHADVLKEIGRAVPPKVELWKSEGRAIAMRWLDRHEGTLPNARRALGMIKGMMDLRMFGGARDDGDRRKLMAARFMLWDGTLPPMHGLDGDNGGPAGDRAPSTYSMSNHPNPFSTSTTIRYTLPNEAHITVRVIDGKGREVARLVDGTQPAGLNTVVFEAGTLPSGSYMVELATPRGKEILQISIVK